MMTYPIIDASRLCLFHGEKCILDEGTFKIFEGQWSEIIGPPNSGKSTLLNAIIGNHDQGSGQLQILGYTLFPVNRDDARLLRRKIGLAQQTPDLLMDKTIRVNLMMALQAADKIKEKPDESIIQEMLDEVGLLAKIKSEIRNLSHTEILTVAILRSIITKPKLILIDQLLEYLEENFRNKLIAILYNLVIKEKIALISTSYLELPNLPFETLRFKLDGGKLLAIN
ncbi:MAG: ATP-binding cassette domain-containing protein [Saprospiraceae bacterium]|nr:ATP-binding cassette domain-containing protein [Saprospiraceae bacterium]